MNTLADAARLQEAMREQGFAFVAARAMHALLDPSCGNADWHTFAASWDDLAPDTYLAAKGRQRRRRHAVFDIDADGALRRAAAQPHFQSSTYNPLQGDIARWFEPVEPAIADGRCMAGILRLCLALFGGMAPDVPRWKAELHQFRIEASAARAGEPTPEGVHRDGVDYVLVLMIARTNIEEGTTTIHDRTGRLLGSFTLTDPLDAALVDDTRVYHGVTAVRPFDPAMPAHRDVLVVTFKALREAGDAPVPGKEAH